MAWVKATLAERSEFLGADTVKHDVTIVDPLEVFGANGALSGFTGRWLVGGEFLFFVLSSGVHDEEARRRAASHQGSSGGYQGC